MVVAHRRPRRSRPLRLFVFASVLTAVVLVGNALARSTGDGVDEQLTYLDTVRPLAERSRGTGRDLADLRARAAELDRDAMRERLARIAKRADETEAAVRSVEPPEELVADHGLFVTTATLRSDAVASLRSTLDAALDPATDPTQTLDALVAIGEQLAVSDQAYLLFVRRAASDAVPAMPDARWVVDGSWSRPELTAFLATVRAGQMHEPVADVGIVTYTLDPSAVGVEGDALVLPATGGGLSLAVVVANMGNEPVDEVTVEAAIAYADGTGESVRNFVDLEPGESSTVNLGNLPLRPGAATLAIRVAPVANETSLGDNEVSRGVVVR